jgi:hypothetical protein
MSAAELRQIIQSGFHIEEFVTTWEEQPVTADWEDSWREVRPPLRGGRDKEEETDDDSEESEEEDTDPETQSVDETVALLTTLEENARVLDDMVGRYGEEASRVQNQLDNPDQIVHPGLRIVVQL